MTRAGRRRLPAACCPTSRATGIWRSRSSSCRSRCSGGRSGIRAPSRAAAATSRSACWRRSPRRTRSARSLFFNVAHYVLRPWPWILVALCSIIVYPGAVRHPARVPEPRSGLLGHDIAYPAMLKFLPAGLRRPDGRRPDRRELVDDPHAPELGRVVPRARFLSPLHRAATPTERHYVHGRPRRDGRALRLCVGATVYLLDTAKDAFDMILQVGAGTGLLYLVRWFWWRVNAWCRDRRDDQLVRRLDRRCWCCKTRRRVQHARGAPHDDRDHDGLLGRDRVPRTGDRSRGARRVLSQGPASPDRDGSRIRRPRAGRCRSESAGRQHPARAAGLGCGLHVDLVGALRGGKLLYGRMPQAIFLTVVFLVLECRAGDGRSPHLGGRDLVKWA